MLHGSIVLRTLKFGREMSHLIDQSDRQPKHRFSSLDAHFPEILVFHHLGRQISN